LRQEIYGFLASRSMEFVSGEALSREFGITRAAIQKHIQAFRSDGAVVTSVNNKGHRLEEYADRLKAEYVMPLMKGSPFHIAWRESAASTNTTAKALALMGSPEFTCVTAEEQTAGKGRMGRAWASPKHKGLYASFILRPNIEAQKASGVTVLTALAVVRALRGVQLDAKIKWPNDVLLSGRKICGILTESSSSMDGIDYIVCGFGLNVNQDAEELPEEIRNIATSVRLEKGAPSPRTKLLAMVLEEIYGLYGEFLKSGLKNLMEEYTGYSALHGRELTLLTPAGEEHGTFAGFDEEAALLVERDGQIKRYISGEISLKGFLRGV